MQFSPGESAASCYLEGLAQDSPQFSRQAVNSGKLSRLLELLEEILEEPSEKALVFTQYLPTLDLVSELVGTTFPSVSVARLHGGLNRTERDEVIRKFSEDPACGVLVLTLGVGSVGLTLTAASHVVHFDRCWNPAKEAQATDRAHRIGQHRTVVVHRLISTDTFEERLNIVLAQKRKLSAAVVPSSDDGARALAELPNAELRKLFCLSSSTGSGTELKASAGLQHSARSV